MNPNKHPFSACALLAASFLFAIFCSPQTGRCGGTVTNCTEADLNAALTNGGTITFTCDGTITITNTKVISTNTTLDASGHNITISGGNTVGAFTVNSNVSLSLFNLTLANGRRTNGGAVYNSSGATLLASNCNFTANSAIGTDGSAGANGGTGGNGSPGINGVAGLGGAIYSLGTVSLLVCDFNSNRSIGGAGGGGGKGGDNSSNGTGGNGGSGGIGNIGGGGAIFNFGTATVIRCSFEVNLASGGNGGSGGAGGNVSVSGSGGNGGPGGAGGYSRGGAIYNLNALSLSYSSLSANTSTAGNAGSGGSGGISSGIGLNGNGALGGVGSGAGLFNLGSATVTNCTFADNTTVAGSSSKAGTFSNGSGMNGSAGGSGVGGGIGNSGTNWLINCTFSTNSATGGRGGDGGDDDPNGGGNAGNGGNGGLGGGGAIYNDGRVAATNCTFVGGGVYGGAKGLAGAGLFAGSDGSIGIPAGGNIANGVGGSFTIKNSLLACKVTDGNAYGTITDAGNNMSSDGTPTLSGTSTNNTDPKLLPLADNGGFTKTCALQTNSPAIDRGDTNSFPVTDQRGVFRTNRCDIGAFEFNGPITSIFFLAGGPTASEDGDIGIFTVYRTNNTNFAQTVNYSITGTASNGVDYVLITNTVTIPTNAYGARITIRPLADGLVESNETVQLTLLTDTNFQYFIDPFYNNGSVTISDTSTFDSSQRFTRGTGTDPNCQSFVIPVDFEYGVRFDAAGGNATNFYPGNLWTTNFYHLSATNPTTPTNISNRIAFQNPITAFGSRVGGTPLYTTLDYSFGVFAGRHAASSLTNSLRILVYYLSNSAYAGTITNAIPDLTDTNQLATFVNSGWTQTTEGFGLRTVLSKEPYSRWGLLTDDSYILTHNAFSSTATNYYYVVEDKGSSFLGEPLVLNQSGAQDWTKLYTLEFNTRPASRALFIDSPQFSGSPLPPAYEGKSLQELTNMIPTMPDVSFLVASDYLTVNGSPELRQHSILDGFVSDMGNDPMALANYVINEIDLTDAIDYDTNQNNQAAVNLGGVNRSALATFQEGQGSPVEQCALLVYLLRQAGVPAAYVYPTNNGLQMLDFQVSKLLRFQVKGALNYLGQTNLPQLIALNYPWVTAYLTNEARWVHIFPWLKDVSVVEGLDLYDYMPTNYNSGHKWLTQFCLGDTNIFSLSADTDQPLDLWPKFIQKQLDTYHPGLSVDDMGVRIINRRQHFAQWDDLPKPFLLSGTPLIWESLKTNLNVFNTLQIRVYSAADTNKFIDTTEMRIADLHNRKLLLKFLQVSTNNAHDMILSLAPYSPGITNQALFGTNADPTFKLVSTNRLTNTDDIIKFQITHKRLRMLPPGYTSPIAFTNLWGYQYFEEGAITPGLTYQTEDAFRKGDLVTFCFDVGRVSRKMLDVQAQELWQFNQTAATNTPAGRDPDIYRGTTAYLAGMSCFHYFDRFADLNDGLHKIRRIGQYQHGYGLLRPQRDTNSLLISNGVVTLIEPAVHIPNLGLADVFNGSLHPDSGRDAVSADLDWWFHLGVQASAVEHGALKSFYRTNAISTVKLLQQVGTNTVHLNRSNYVGYADKLYNGVKLKDADPVVWSKVTNFFAAGLYDEEALMTPGVVTNGGYHGVGAFLISSESLDSIVGGLNGGISADFSAPTFQDANSVNIKAVENPDNSVTDYSVLTSAPTNNAGYLVNSGGANFEQSTTRDAIANGQERADPTLAAQATQANIINGTPNASTANGYGIGENTGSLGNPVAHNDGSLSVLDPVNSITGEFYIDAVDLMLPGAIPLQVRRNYGSQNLAENEFGFGWKINYVPFITLSTNSTLAYAAEMDGTVVAYRVQNAPTNTLWLPTAADNITLNNNSSAGIGSLANLFNNRLTMTNISGTNIYSLTGADGSVRTFVTRSFSFGGFSHTRPYLDNWRDNRSNSYTFQFGTNSSQPEFGHLRRIQSSSGSFLGFYYDIYGHITEAYTGDGRRLFYDYDKFGDLTTVTLPDVSQINYEYQHLNYVTNSVTNLYSTHLIVRELKPDGRILKNDYDSLRRVTNQYATVAADLSLIRNGTFIYTNNYAANTTNLISGTTDILDYTNRLTRYYYTNSLLRKIIDPLNHTNLQDWFEADTTNGAYRRSLKSTTDKRGLQTFYLYDGSGNITNVTVLGDLTGNGLTNEQANSTFLFNTNSLVTQSVDPSGATNRYFYTNDWLLNRIEHNPLNASGANIITNSFSYYSVTNPLNSAQFSLGLRQREVRADGCFDAAITEWSHEYRGFPTNEIRYSGTDDPNVTHQFLYNGRGELVERTDAAGRKQRFGFDPLGRPEWQEVYEAGQSAPLAATDLYYNANGELVWTDGPASGPEDYVFRDYDGAGRKTEETHWRAQAKGDGTGLEALPDSLQGDGLYASTFFRYDPFSNLILITNPRGVSVSNAFDGIGQMLASTVIDANGAVLKTESFIYEPGGIATNYTNPLGGTVQKRIAQTGKPTFQQNPDGSTSAWRYYLDGRLATNFLSNGAYWQTIYNDANRTVTNIFYSAASVPLATNSTAFDRRGNVIRSTDVERFTSTNYFDGLDRVKFAAGPAIVTVVKQWDFTKVTNIVQQVITNFYDASGQTLTAMNAIGEFTVTTFDALNRPLSSAIYNADGTLVRTNSMAYSADHHSSTMIAGSGTNAIVTTTFTDNDGRPVLTQHFPVVGQTSPSSPMEFTLQKYDVVGNLVEMKECSSSNGAVTIWATNLWTYDGLNRQSAETIKDGATTAFGYNALGNPTNRAVPDGLNWSASFNSAGQILSEQLTGGGLTSRAFTYSYYSAGNAAVGRLQTMTDGRGVAKTTTYDDFLRPAIIAASGSNDAYNLTITNQFDRRGLLTNTVQTFANTNFSPQTGVRRVYDGYGHVVAEDVSIGSEPRVKQSAQAWDNAGRRTSLSFPSVIGQGLYYYGYRADGEMISMSAGFYVASAFAYANNGLLVDKVSEARALAMSRDGRGRILQADTTVQGTLVLSESLVWRGDGRLTGYSAVRNDYTDTRSYGYSAMARRLTNETLAVASSQNVTNSYGVDSGQSGKLGIITSADESGAFSSAWSSSVDGLRRVNQQQTTLLERPATGRAVGAAVVNATVNGRSVPVSYDPDNTNGSWRANMTLSPGVNALIVSATHPRAYHADPNVLFTAAATNIYTNSITVGDSRTNTLDGNGNLLARTKRDGSNNVVVTQTLVWDANDRLISVSERDPLNNGYDWSAVYDPLGRRLRTTYTLVISNAPQPSPTVLDSFYDPQVEFLEVGVSSYGEYHWKAYGPDLSGRYGGMQGVGGLESVTANTPVNVTDAGIVSDVFGDALGMVDLWGTQTWFSTRVSAYGPVPGYPALPLERDQTGNDRLPPTLTWRGLRIDPTGLYCIGARYYDPQAARFISADPMGFGGGSDLNGFCQGDPINFFDPDGRYGKPAGIGLAEGLKDFGVGGFHGLNLILPGGGLSELLYGRIVDKLDSAFVEWRDSVVSNFTPSQGNVYAGAGFLGETLPNAIPIAGAEEASASIFARAEGWAAKNAPILAEDLGQLALRSLQWFGESRLNPVNYSFGGRLFTGMPLPEFLPRASGDVPELVYRGGSATADNLTPRPILDPTGLSTFDNLEAATLPGGKAQIIDTSKLRSLSAVPDAPPPGHVSITPEDDALIAKWAATRGTGQIHPLTQELLDAIVGVARRPK